MLDPPHREGTRNLPSLVQIKAWTFPAIAQGVEPYHDLAAGWPNNRFFKADVLLR